MCNTKYYHCNSEDGGEIEEDEWEEKWEEENVVEVGPRGEGRRVIGEREGGESEWEGEKEDLMTFMFF